MDNDAEKDPYEIAQEKIEAALLELLESEREEYQVTEFLNDWILVAASHVENPGEEGNACAYRRITRVDQALHSTIGLLKRELTVAEHVVVCHGD